MSCAPCLTAAETGWWGDPKITHCTDCHLSWSRTSRLAHCASCHRTFGGDSAFTAHRRHGICVDPATIDLDKPNAPGYVETLRGPMQTPVWGRPSSDTFEALKRRHLNAVEAIPGGHA